MQKRSCVKQTNQNIYSLLSKKLQQRFSVQPMNSYKNFQNIYKSVYGVYMRSSMSYTFCYRRSTKMSETFLLYLL